MRFLTLLVLAFMAPQVFAWSDVDLRSCPYPMPQDEYAFGQKVSMNDVTACYPSWPPAQVDSELLSIGLEDYALDPCQVSVSHERVVDRALFQDILEKSLVGEPWSIAEISSLMHWIQDNDATIYVGAHFSCNFTGQVPYAILSEDKSMLINFIDLIWAE